MANTIRINQILEKLGYEPEEGKSIVVSYAPENLSDIIRKLLWNNYYSLSLCKDSIVLLPFSSCWADVKKEVSESGLNYRIDIRLEDEVISLSAQQAELSFLRSSGCLSLENYTFVNNWHSKNLKGTLKALKEFGVR